MAPLDWEVRSTPESRHQAAGRKSAKCQKRTLFGSLDHLIGERERTVWNFNA